MAKRPAYPNHVGTIGGKIRMGHGLWVHCDNRACLHRARIDLEAIAERYGAELSVAEFVNSISLVRPRTMILPPLADSIALSGDAFMQPRSRCGSQCGST